MLAQSIHNSSNKKCGPFLAVNCAAIPENLIESEFFGYEEGAFTGAKKNGKPGVFELAHNGTIFLDEISEIPMNLQGRLLRVLQEKEVMRIGGNRLIPIDVRIITASNKNLSRMIKEEKFRTDLFYRINVLTLKVPSLHERKGDIPILAEYFAKKYSRLYNKPVLAFSDEEKIIVNNMRFEGNVRELENLMERAVILSSLECLLDKNDASSEVKINEVNEDEVGGEYLMSLKEMEEYYINRIYEKTRKNSKETAEILGINRSTLWRKFKKKD